MEKYFKNEDAEPYLEPCPLSMMEYFCENTTAKTFVIDVWYASKCTLEAVQDSKINLKWMNTKMVKKNVHLSMWILQRISVGRDIPRYQKQQFARVLLNSRSWKFGKIYRDASTPESLFNLQPSTLLKKRRRHIYTPVSPAKLFRNTFIMENILRTGF